MLDMQWIIEAPDAYPPVAKKVLQALGSPPRLLLLHGQIGAGKTTLVQELCRQLGVTEPVTSPTFALVNEYAASAGRVYHLDLYRLQALEEALHIGIEEYLDSGQYCFIEWPDLLEPLLPEDSIRLELEVLDDNRRKILLL